jgi:hypothetical protein
VALQMTPEPCVHFEFENEARPTFPPPTKLLLNRSPQVPVKEVLSWPLGVVAVQTLTRPRSGAARRRGPGGAAPSSNFKMLKMK